VYIPAGPAAASFVPSELDAIEYKTRLVVSYYLFSVSNLLLPELELVHIPPSIFTTANFVPSELEAIQVQNVYAGKLAVRRVQSPAPVLVLVHIPPNMPPPPPILFRPELDAIDCQTADGGKPPPVCRVQTPAPELAFVHIPP